MRVYPRLIELGPLTIYSYGVLLAAAYLLGLKLAMVRAKPVSSMRPAFSTSASTSSSARLIGAKVLLLVTDFNAAFETIRASC